MQIEREYFGPVNRSGRNKPQQTSLSLKNFQFRNFLEKMWSEGGVWWCNVVQCNVMKGRR